MLGVHEPKSHFTSVLMFSLFAATWVIAAVRLLTIHGDIQMPKAITAVLLVLTIALPAISQDNVRAEPKFSSKAAKAAVAGFRQKVAMLNTKLEEQIDLARAEMNKDLEGALKDAVDKKDFSEVQRISSFIESKMQLAEKPPRSLKKAQMEIGQLKKKIESLTPSDDRGIWMHSSGYYAKGPGTDWFEKYGNGKKDPFIFKETARTREYIEIENYFNTSHKFRLYNDRVIDPIRNRTVYRGSWRSTAPTE